MRENQSPFQSNRKVKFMPALDAAPPRRFRGGHPEKRPLGKGLVQSFAQVRKTMHIDSQVYADAQFEPGWHRWAEVFFYGKEQFA